VLELTLRVAAAEVEEVLDAVLPALPGGIHVRPEGEQVSLTVYGAPDEDELRRLAGSRLVDLSRVEAPDGWRDRRRDRYEPVIVAERFLLRPDWAPPGEDPGLIEIVLGQSAAFGTGLHPTTQACLATLAELEPGGSFADYGCGSGVLSIAAAHLGWSPVVAVDVDPTSVDAARRNGEANGVEIDARRVDLTADPAPPAQTIAANIPPAVQQSLAERLGRAPALLIASGFHPDQIPAVTAAWGAHGLQVSDEVRANEWSVLVMR
jgi:ribosomal protein L11 methyltransferase